MKIETLEYQKRFNENCRETLILLEKLHKIKAQRRQDIFLSNVGVVCIGVIQVGITVAVAVQYLW